MKIVSILMAVIFTCVLGFSALPGNVYAKSSTKKVTAEKSTKKADKGKKKTAKKVDKAKKKSAKKTVKGKSTTKAKKATPKNLNINSADKATLMLLPGIGPKTADAVLKYRKANGKFKSISDLKNVKGIGDKTLAKLKPFLKKI